MERLQELKEKLKTLKNDLNVFTKMESKTLKHYYTFKENNEIEKANQYYKEFKEYENLKNQTEKEFDELRKEYFTLLKENKKGA